MMLAMYSTIAVFFILHFYSIIELPLPPMLQVVFSFDIFLYLGVMFYQLFKGASYNAEFDAHISKIRRLKQPLVCIMANMKQFLSCDKSFYTNPTISTYYRLYKSMYPHYFSLDPEEFKVLKAKVRARTEKTITQLDFLQEQLEHEKEHNALKLLGITANFNLIASILSACAALGAAMLQYSFGIS